MARMHLHIVAVYTIVHPRPVPPSVCICVFARCFQLTRTQHVFVYVHIHERNHAFRDSQSKLEGFMLVCLLTDE